MPLELIYTSAPRGLDQGACGFCTVQRTAGLDLVLQRQLESISSLGSTASAAGFRNSEIYLHTFAVGPMGICRVLSRITVGGEDYSGRPNLVAHHLVLPIAECPPCGPAVLAAAEGILSPSWDGRVAQVNPRRITAPTVASPPSANTWATLFGDLGWAGVVLFELSRARNQPVWVIVPDGTNTLQLLTELTLFLAPDERWGISFATEFQPLPAGTQCQLRFVSSSSPLATNIRNRQSTGVVDLTQHGRIPTDAESFVTSVRNRRLVRLAEGTFSNVPASAASGTSGGADLWQLAMQESRQQSNSGRIRGPEVVSMSSLSLPTTVGNNGQSSAKSVESQRNMFRITGLISLALATLMICGGGTAFILHAKNEAKQKDDNRVAKEKETAKQQKRGEDVAAAVSKLKSALSELENQLKLARDLPGKILITNSQEPPATDSLMPSEVATFFQMLNYVPVRTKEAEKELIVRHNAYLEAVNELKVLDAENALAAENEVRVQKERVENEQKTLLSQGHAAENMQTIKGRLKPTQLARSRSEIQKDVDDIKALKIDTCLDDLRPYTMAPNSVPGDKWIKDRWEKMCEFAGETDTFSEIHFRPIGNGFLVRLPVQVNSTKDVRVLVPNGMQDQLSADHVQIEHTTPSDPNGQSDDWSVLIQGDSPQRCHSALVCLHIRGDLLDRYYVRNLDAGFWHGQEDLASFLCRLNELQFVCNLRQGDDTSYLVRGTPSEKASEKELALTFARVLPADSVAKVFLESSPGVATDGLSNDDFLRSKLNDILLEYWRNVTLTQHGLICRKPERRSWDALKQEVDNGNDGLSQNDYIKVFNTIRPLRPGTDVSEGQEATNNFKSKSNTNSGKDSQVESLAKNIYLRHKDLKKRLGSWAPDKSQHSGRKKEDISLREAYKKLSDELARLENNANDNDPLKIKECQNLLTKMKFSAMLSDAFENREYRQILDDLYSLNGTAHWNVNLKDAGLLYTDENGKKMSREINFPAGTTVSLKFQQPTEVSADRAEPPNANPEPPAMPDSK